MKTQVGTVVVGGKRQDGTEWYRLEGKNAFATLQKDGDDVVGALITPFGRTVIIPTADRTENGFHLLGVKFNTEKTENGTVVKMEGYDEVIGYANTDFFGRLEVKGLKRNSYKFGFPVKLLK